MAKLEQSHTLETKHAIQNFIIFSFLTEVLLLHKDIINTCMAETFIIPNVYNTYQTYWHEVPYGSACGGGNVGY